MVLEKRVTTFIIAREKPFAENGTNGTEEQPLIESACTRCNKFTNEISRHKDYFFFCPVFHLHLCKTARQVIFVGHSRPLALLIAHYRKSQHLPQCNSRWHTYFAQSRPSVIRKETGRCPKHPAYQCPRDTNKKSTYLTHEWFGQSSWWIQELTMNAVLLCCTANNPDFPTPNSLCLLTKGS